MDSRRENFKTSAAASSAGQRRRQIAVNLGKERRDAAVRAKRIRRSEEDNEEMQVHEDEEALENHVRAAVEGLIAANKDTHKGASTRKLELLKNVRKLISSTSLPPVNAAVEAGLIPVLVDFLGFGSNEEQLLEAAWCLTNIAAGDVHHARAVLASVPLLIAHLGDSSPPAVVEQCSWALGNLAGDSEEIREILLAQGALLPLGRLLSTSKGSLARTVCWSLSNFIKGPSSKAVSELLKLEGILQGLLQHLQTEDEALVAEAAWVLVYISSLSDIKPLMNTGFVEPLVKWLASSKQLMVLTPVLRTIGNIVCGDNSKTDAVIAAGSSLPGGVAEVVSRCLESDARALQKEGAWVISNIAAGSLEHKHLLFPVAYKPLIRLISSSTFDVKKEAAYALGNLCVAPKERGKPAEPIVEHLQVLVQSGCINEFVNLVKLPDLEASKLGLQFLELVMRSIPNGPKLVDNCDGMLAIEMVHFHENEELRNMANCLLDTYFNEEYEIEEEYGPEGLQALKS